MQRLVVALFVALDVAARYSGPMLRPDVAAGAGATPAAFYLGLCRLRVVLSPPAPHDHAAGGPFFAATTTAAGGPFYFATKKIGIGRSNVAAKTAVGGPFYLPARWRCIDS